MKNLKSKDQFLGNGELAKLLIASNVTGLDEARYEKEYLLRSNDDQIIIDNLVLNESKMTHSKLIRLSETKSVEIRNLRSLIKISLSEEEMIKQFNLTIRDIVSQTMITQDNFCPNLTLVEIFKQEIPYYKTKGMNAFDSGYSS